MSALDQPIAGIGLAAQTVRVLQRAKMALVRDLVQRTDADLLKTNGINRKRLQELREKVADLGLSLGMRLPEALEPLPPPSQLALDVLAGGPAAIDALALGAPAAWQVFLEHLILAKPPHAAAVAVDAFLAREPSPGRWLELASRALFDIDSQVFTTATSAMRRLSAWLADGIVAAHGPAAVVALEIRIEREKREAAGSETAFGIVSDLRGAQVPAALLAEALVVLARRLAEEGAHEAAIEALTEADTAGHPLSRRLRAASLLALERLDDAFALLDPELVAPAPERLGGAFRFAGTSQDPWTAALNEAAQLAGWASATTPEWVRALGAIAERADVSSRPALWARFEHTLQAMVDTSNKPGSDLEVVIRQAKQRKLKKTAKAAEGLAKQRGITLVPNPHFG